jgi:hypothetical protein
MRMSDGSLVTKHLNEYIVISELLFAHIKIIEGEKCISLLCSLPNS